MVRNARAAGRAIVVAELGLSVGCVGALAKLGVPASKRRHAHVGERVARRVDRLGGAYLKIGQLLSTRADLLADEQRAPFARLCDQATPVRPETWLASLRDGDLDGLVEVQRLPFATGSFTHVHLARRRDTGQRVVVKVLRPDAHARFSADVALILGFSRIGARLPLLSSVPVMDAVKLLAQAIGSHLDLTTEAALQGRLSEQLSERSDVVVPKPHLDLSDSTMLVMDHVASARRIDDRRLDPQLQRDAALAALRALYTMLFDGGLVHCDLHPGNMLVTDEGKLVLIDVGYASQLDEDQQTAFAELFKAMALADADLVAQVVLQTATRLPDRVNRDALVSDLATIVDRVAGRSAAEFNVAAFVTNLFAVQRRHRIVASPGFTMGIVALVMLEGVLKQLTPALDFQREAMPFVLGRLQAARRDS